MKLPQLARIRLPILMTLLVGEFVSGIYFYIHRLQQPHGEGRFWATVLLSLEITPLLVAALWLDWIRRRRVPYYHVFMVVATALFAVSSLTKGEWVYAILFAAMFIVFMLSVLLRLLRHVDLKTQESNFESLRVEDNKLGPIARNSIGLVVWLGLTAWSWSRAQRPIHVWAFFLILVPALWFLWRLIFNLAIKRGEVQDVNASAELNIKSE